METGNYTIKDAAKMMGVPTSTIRYYDKEGLLPFMERRESGYRIFTERILQHFVLLIVLKKQECRLKKFVNLAIGLNRVMLLYNKDMKCF